MITPDKLPRLRYSALERIGLGRPVDRVAFITDYVKSKFVFDLGALDETAIDAKRDTNEWLHARICASASRVVGIDNSSKLPQGGMKTLNGGRIIDADIFDLAPVIETFGKPEVVVAGELIEHLPNALLFLQSLRNTPGMAGADLVFSTPNACCIHNALVGMARMESMHPDHLQVFSYKTLRTLFSRSSIELIALIPTYARFPEMVESSSGVRKIAVSTFQRSVNALEFAFPILSAGWIGVARI